MSAFDPPIWRVYKLVSSDVERPIYVGMTADPHSRITAHRCTGPVSVWLAEDEERSFDFVVIRSFADRAAASVFEGEMIAKFRPSILNKIGRGGGGRARIGDSYIPASAGAPWIAAGVSRSTWYRARRNTAHMVSPSEREAG